jgi:hypothetical protein
MTKRRLLIGLAVGILLLVVLAVLFVVITYYGPVTTETGMGTVPG